ncbi:hypothetical protein AAC387_Pa02g3290 [Persea americana]
MAFLATTFLVSYLSLLSLSFQTTLQNQSHFFTLIQQTMSGNSFSEWNISNNSNSTSNNTLQSPYCNYVGITCDDDGYVTEIDFTSWFLTGHIPSDICSNYLPKLRVLRMAYNNIHDGFPTSILNCSLLQELDLSHSKISGTLPDLSPLKSLRLLDLSYSLFYGEFPLSVTNLTSLEQLNFNENGGFRLWKLPEEITRLTKLKRMLLMTCSVHGFIPGSIGNMSSLVDLELSGNYLVGQIPAELGRLKNLESLQLYYNGLVGEIPDEIGNLTQLFDIDFSVNRLTGKIPESLCSLPNLAYLQLYNNSLSGEIPPAIGNLTSLSMLSVYLNFLTGEIPRSIGKYSDLNGLDLSENELSGELPPDVCRGGKLVYFLVLDNQLSGRLPENYAKCNSLIRFRVSHNSLSGQIPDGVLGLPNAAIIDLGSNHFEGPFPNSIQNAKNLSEFYIQGNRISGTLPLEISKATNLVKIDLSNNLLSGPIPSEIGNLGKLNVLLLQSNKLVSSIPKSLSLLKSLNLLNLSNNLLSGRIPDSLCQLLPNSLDFSNNRLSGPVPVPLIKEGLVESYSGNPGLCAPEYFNSSSANLPPCEKIKNRNRLIFWVVGVSAFIIILGLLVFLKRRLSRESVVMEQDALSCTSSFSYDIKSFRKLSFNQREIIEALIEKNVIGYGGSGTVYKIELSNGQSVAVKKLWTSNTMDLLTDQLFLDRELKAEVETLGNIRHKNIVKLYCCFSNADSSLLVYEYMPNGNLWDSLHQNKGVLDWPTRHRIALGVAQGLAYLHHDLLPPIIHRDIKSTNILLDADFEPKVADFGVAKVLQARVMESSTTVVAGTYGYLAPEYAYSSKATAKCDVYSFGVVLMELITGRKPVEAEFGENKSIVFWISHKVATKDGVMEVLDKRLSGWFKDCMIQVLRIAIRCTCSTPALRPTMKEVVKLMIDAAPCRVDACKTSEKIKGSHPQD